MKKVLSVLDQFHNSVPNPKQRLPQALQFPINNICNSRCQMCEIWKQKKQPELSPAEIRKILANPLFREVNGVGINGGEPTLRKDIGEVTRAIAESLPKLGGIALITNAINYKQVTEGITAVGTVCQEHGINLDVMVSLDGIGEVHDRVRGRQGNFESAVKVIDFIQNSPLVKTTRIGCTVIRENVFDVENVLNWCIEKGIYARFRLGVPHQRLYTRDIVEPFALTKDESFHFANFLDHLYHHYEKNETRRAFYRSLRDQLVYGRPRSSGCDWKYRGATLLPSGELAYCAVESKALGNVLCEDAEKLYWDNADHLGEITATKCASCHHDYEGTANRKVYLRHVSRLILDKKIPKPIGNFALSRVREYLDKADSGRIKKALATANTTQRTAVGALPKRVLISGWYGTETLGDKAILGGVIKALHNLPIDYEIDLAAIEPYVSQHTVAQMPEIGIDRVLSLAEAKAAVRGGSYACVVIGGGPLMSTIRECTDLLELFAEAKAVGARCMVAGSGVGPLYVPHRNRAIAAILKLADEVVLRDQGSLALAKKTLGFTGNASVMLDPAFLWLEQHRRPLAPKERKQILLALRDWPITEYGRHLDPAQALKIKHRFEEEIRRFVDELTTLDPEVRVVPFCMHKLAIGGDDREFYRRIFANHPAVLENLDARHRSPHDDLQLIEQSRAILAMRFHSVVFSVATRTPFLAIDYTLGGKIHGLLHDLGARDCLVDLKQFDGVAAARKLWNEEFRVTGLEDHTSVSENTLTDAFSRILLNEAAAPQYV